MGSQKFFMFFILASIFHMTASAGILATLPWLLTTLESGPFVVAFGILALDAGAFPWLYFAAVSLLHRR